MKTSDLKKMIINSLDGEVASDETLVRLENAGVSYSFSPEFRERVINRIFTAGTVINREVEFVRSLNSVFYRIALTGIAAIFLLLVSMYIMEGSISLNTIFGLNDGWGESIICLLTGN
jgi:hypothetical protein